MGSFSSKAPKVPDPAIAAREDAKSSKENIATSTYANRVDQFNPWGNTTYEAFQDYDPATEQDVTRWRQYETLNPQLQSSLDAELELQRSRSELGASKADQLKSDIGQSMDWSQFGEQTSLAFNPDQLRERAEGAAYKRATSRLDPRFAQEGSDMEIKLKNQGLQPGDEAYDRAMGNFGRDKNDAYAAAQQSAVGQGLAESNNDFNQQIGASNYANQLRSAQIQEEMSRRSQNLNEATAVINGTQVQSPQMATYNTSGTANGSNMLGAANAAAQNANNQYSANQASKQGLLSGIGTIAGAVSSFSDRRLKKSIEFLGEWKGQKWYVWEYIFGGRGLGHMSDEVNQDAVTVRPDGFEMVDYSRVRYSDV